jgi:uncharacterized damage-inducible protein DinB
MASEPERLEEQLRRSFEGEAWHGPSVLESLAGVSAEVASQHPIAGAHSIWELVLHLIGTYRLVLRRLRSDGTPLAAQEDWPPPPAFTPVAWNGTIQTLTDLNHELRQAIAAFPAERLDSALVPGAPATAYTQFIGVTQHDLYHAGQMAVLKRAAAGAGV